MAIHIHNLLPAAAGHYTLCGTLLPAMGLHCMGMSVCNTAITRPKLPPGTPAL